VLRVFVRTSWSTGVTLEGTTVGGISGTNEIFRAKSLKNAADVATCYHIIIARVSYVNLIARDFMW